MYHWELDDIAHQQLASLPNHVRRELATFMDATVVVDPVEYQRAPGEHGKPPDGAARPATRWGHRQQS